MTVIVEQSILLTMMDRQKIESYVRYLQEEMS